MGKWLAGLDEMEVWGRGEDGGGDGGVMVGLWWGYGGGEVFFKEEKTGTLLYPRLSIGPRRAAVMD